MCATGWCEFWFYSEELSLPSFDELVSQLGQRFSSVRKTGPEKFCVDLPSGHEVRGDYWLADSDALRVAIGSPDTGERKIDLLPVITWLSEFEGIDFEDHMEHESLVGFRIKSDEIDEYVWGSPVRDGIYRLRHQPVRTTKLRAGAMMTYRRSGEGAMLYAGTRAWPVSEAWTSQLYIAAKN